MVLRPSEMLQAHPRGQLERTSSHKPNTNRKPVNTHLHREPHEAAGTTPGPINRALGAPQASPPQQLHHWVLEALEPVSTWSVAHVGSALKGA